MNKGTSVFELILDIERYFESKIFKIKAMYVHVSSFCKRGFPRIETSFCRCILISSCEAGVRLV